MRGKERTIIVKGEPESTDPPELTVVARIQYYHKNVLLNKRSFNFIAFLVLLVTFTFNNKLKGSVNSGSPFTGLEVTNPHLQADALGDGTGGLHGVPRHHHHAHPSAVQHIDGTGHSLAGGVLQPHEPHVHQRLGGGAPGHGYHWNEKKRVEE